MNIKSYSAIAASVSLAAGGLLAVPAAVAAVPAPTFHWDFENESLSPIAGAATLTVERDCSSAVTTPSCNSSTGFGSDSNGGYWEWASTAPRGGGFTVTTPAPIGETYSIALKFSFAQVNGYRKIIDYKNRVTDTGFYVLSGRVNFYNLGTGTVTFAANDVLDLVAVRDSDGTATGGTFTVYLNANGALTKLLEVSDANGQSIPFVTGTNESLLGFFFDDNATSSEATNAGKIWDLKMWPGVALSASEVEAAISGGTERLTTPSSFQGPVLTPLSVGSVSAGSSARISGERLDQVSGLTLGGLPVSFERSTNGDLVIQIPAGLLPGTYDLVLSGEFGSLRVQGFLTITSGAVGQTGTFWSKANADGSKVTLYAKNPVGQGKVQFFVDGREVAWVRAVDATDPKLRVITTDGPMAGVSYLVRTVELNPGKNRFEIRVNGERVWRATYLPQR